MEIRINRLIISNFKGIKSLTIDFAGRSLNISGANATGKTTIFDAFTWCLFGKDSLGRTDTNSDFAIKPTNKNGEAEHNLETSVELELLIDGNVKIFKRAYHEVYTKKRGSTDLVFDGHTTDCYINGIEKALKDYKAEIDALINEDLFKMLTSTSHFNSLDWSKRRDIVFALAGDVKDQEIIDVYPELKSLENELVLGKTVDDVLAQVKRDKASINRQLDAIPAQIRTLKDTQYKNLGVDYDDAKNQIALDAAYEKLSKLESEKAANSTSEEINKHQETILGFKDEIRKLEAKKADMILKAKEDKQAEIDKVRSDLRKTQTERDMLNITNATLQKRIDNGLKEIENEESRKKKLLDDYHVENKKTFTPENCSYCGQALPQEKIAELENKFNLEKANTLEDIIANGKERAANIKKYSAEVDKLLTERKANDDKIGELDDLISDFTSKLNAAEIELKNIKVDTSETDAEIEKIQERIKTIENVVSRLRTKTDTSIYDQTIKELKSEIAYLSDKKAEYRLKLQNDERISKLEEEHKDLQKKYEKAEEIQTLCERFVEAKATYLESKINNNFEIVKFKLFKELVNGGIEPTCVATVDGVVLPSLNNGKRINAGLDIIKVLQRIYGVKAPIFIDNAESVSNWLISIDCQLIKLYVSENDKELRIERE
jgi:chromosome segregation ATPase